MADEDRVLETSAESLWDESSFSVATGHPVAVDDDRVIEAVLRSVNLDYGLSSADVEHERKTAGFNEEPQHHVSWVLRLVRNFVGVAPVILEATFIAAMALQEWIEAGVVLALLIFNAIVGFVQDTRAVRAMARLHSSLQINARVLRDGNWNQILARELVPGDVVKIRQGDMVPADLVTIRGELRVDQSALTGESNAVAKLEGSRIFAGSMVTSGETKAVVVFTGLKTRFNTTVHLVQMSNPKLHMTRVITKVVAAEMTIAGIMILVAIIVLLVNPVTRATFGSVVPLLLILFALSAPVTLPPMITLTMALGSQKLVSHHILTVRLNALEDAASMTVLCTDKTGTLTLNRLSVVETTPAGDFSQSDVLLLAAAASKAENVDAIDLAVLEAARPVLALSDSFLQINFVPFSAATRKTSSIVKFANGTVVRACKGAVKTLLDDCACNEELRAGVAVIVSEASAHGHRVLAVSVQQLEPEATSSQFVGLLAMADPPRADTQAAIQALRRLGIRVLMLTGDALPIAKYVGEQTGVGVDIRTWHKDQSVEKVLDACGLAEIFPEDKHAFVRVLQDKQHEVVGMTGDGVNDAAALKQAEVGIAMFNATDVAKSASSVVLMTEGLGTVPIVVEIGRQIHARLVTWMLIRLVKTFQTVSFIVLMYLIRGEWIVTSLNLLELLFLIDFMTLTLSTDNVSISAGPCTWNVLRLCAISLVVGLIKLGETVALWYLVVLVFNLQSDIKLINTASFVMIFFMGIATIFAMRVRSFFWTIQPSWWLLIVSLADVVFVVVACAVGIGALSLARISMGVIGIIIGWSVVFQLVINNLITILLFRLILPSEHRFVSLF